MAGPIKRRHNTACSAKQECQGRRRAWVNGAVAISNCLIVSGQGACVFILPWAYASAEMLSPTSGGTEPVPPLTSPASRPGNVELFRLQAQRQCLQRHTDVMLCFWYCEAGDLVYPSRMFKRT